MFADHMLRTLALSMFVIIASLFPIAIYYINK